MGIPDVTELVEEQLQSNLVESRAQAIASLCSMAPESAVEVISQRFAEEPAAELQCDMLRTLRSMIHSDDPRLLRTLCAAMDQGDEVRELADTLVGEISRGEPRWGPDGQVARTALLQVKRPSRQLIAYVCHRFLARDATDDDRDLAFQMLKRSTVQDLSAESWLICLNRFDPSADQVLPILEEVLRSENPDAIEFACRIARDLAERGSGDLVVSVVREATLQVRTSMDFINLASLLHELEEHFEATADWLADEAGSWWPNKSEDWPPVFWGSLAQLFGADRMTTCLQHVIDKTLLRKAPSWYASLMDVLLCKPLTLPEDCREAVVKLLRDRVWENATTFSPLGGAAQLSRELFKQRRRFQLNRVSVANLLACRSVANAAAAVLARDTDDALLVELADVVYANVSERTKRKCLERWPMKHLPQNSTQLLEDIRQTSQLRGRDPEWLFKRVLQNGGFLLPEAQKTIPTCPPDDFHVFLFGRADCLEALRLLFFLDPEPAGEVVRLLPWLELQFASTDAAGSDLTWFVGATREHSPEAAPPPHDVREVIGNWNANEPWNWGETFAIRLPEESMATYHKEAMQQIRDYKAAHRGALGRVVSQLETVGRNLTSQIRKIAAGEEEA